VAPTGAVPAAERPDGLHMDPDVVERHLEGELGAALRAAYRAVVADPRADLRPARPTTWSA
jgi:hypothetical protein